MYRLYSSLDLNRLRLNHASWNKVGAAYNSAPAHILAATLNSQLCLPIPVVVFEQSLTHASCPRHQRRIIQPLVKEMRSRNLLKRAPKVSAHPRRNTSSHLFQRSTFRSSQVGRQRETSRLQFSQFSKWRVH